MSLDHLSTELLVSKKYSLIDKLRLYFDELDRNNDKKPSDEVRRIIKEYKAISKEISSRESNVRKFERIIDSNLTVKKYYQEMDNYSQNFITVSNDWYSAHHDYRTSMV